MDCSRRASRLSGSGRVIDRVRAGFERRVADDSRSRRTRAARGIVVFPPGPDVSIVPTPTETLDLGSPALEFQRYLRRNRIRERFAPG